MNERETKKYLYGYLQFIFVKRDDAELY